MRLYKEFIDFSKGTLDEFFENVPLFDNQFQYDETSEMYYQKLFLEQRDADEIKTVAELKEEIPGYAELYRKAGSYYMNPRNKSVKGLDVQMGIVLEDLVMDFLHKKFKLRTENADFSNKSYPDCMVLGSDGGILAYFEVKYHGAPFITSKSKIGREPYEGSATLDLKKVKKQIDLIESDLDRPTFYLHWIDYHDLKGIFFESSQQVKEYIYENENGGYGEFTRNERSGDFMKDDDYEIIKKIGYTEKIYSPLFEMGTFEEFINVLLNLKSNGVPQTDYGL